MNIGADDFFDIDSEDTLNADSAMAHWVMSFDGRDWETMHAIILAIEPDHFVVYAYETALRGWFGRIVVFSDRKLSDCASTIEAYPTQREAIAGAWRMARRLWPERLRIGSGIN